MRLAALLLFLSFCPAFGQYSPTDNVQQWQLDQLVRDAKNEKMFLEARQHQVEESQYDHRPPTKEEVEVMEKRWKDANPFTFGGRMPDFSKQSIRVTRDDRQSANINDTGAEAAQLAAKIAALEKRLAQMEKTKTTAPHAAQKTIVKARPVANDTPSQPNPASVTLRKLPNGQVMAIVGSKMMQFKTEAEAQAYINSLKH